MPDFKLSQELQGHGSDVRAALFPAPDVVVTASRDKSVRVWKLSRGPPPAVQDSSVLYEGDGFINSLAIIPGTGLGATPQLVSGNHSSLIDIRPLRVTPPAGGKPDEGKTLVGHGHNVCALDVGPSGQYLVSGGWDHQAFVWNLGKAEVAHTLQGHHGNVWAVLALSPTKVATGCADAHIRLFNLEPGRHELQPAKEFHALDVVRALCRVPNGHPSGADIASATNDGVIRLWSLDGRRLGELHGHESFIYSLAALPTGELVSSGEDRTVRIWRGTECVQTITHPAISVWAVAVCQQNGDIVTGASDGAGRIFTRDSKRLASEKDLASFQDLVQQSAIPEQQLGGINKDQLPGPDFITTRKGTKDGQVQMVNEANGEVSAYQWSNTGQEWVKVGTVVGGGSVGSSGRKVEYNGASYDYVFDVAIEEGTPALKLPFNLSDNPHSAAAKFIADNELPQGYHDQVVNFIIKNTQGQTIGSSSSAQPTGSDSGFQPSSRKIIPLDKYLFLTSAKFDPIMTRISSINKGLLASGAKEAALNSDMEETLRGLDAVLAGTQPPTERQVGLLVGMVQRWPYADRMPALDLLRCIAGHDAVALWERDGASVVSLVLDSVAGAGRPAGTPQNENQTTMAARLVANLFATQAGVAVLELEADAATKFLAAAVGAGGGGLGAVGKSKLLHMAVVTATLNFAVSVAGQKSDALATDDITRLLSILEKLLTSQTDGEVTFRALVALGTLLTVSNGGLGAATIRGWIAKAVDKVSEERVKNVADECKSLLK